MHVLVVCLYAVLLYVLVGLVHAVGVIVLKQRIFDDSLLLEIVANVILWPLDFAVYMVYTFRRML